MLDQPTFAKKALEMENLMYRVACGMLRNEADRYDAMQQALLSAWEKRHTLRREELFSTWLIRILINACKGIYRRQRRLIPMERLPETPVDPPGMEVRDAVERLPEKQRVVVMLHYLEGLPTNEIARLLRIPGSTVRGRLAKARKSLRLVLSEEEESHETV